MMILQNFRTKQTYYRRLGRKQPAMDQALQIHDTYFLFPKTQFPDGKLVDGGDLQPALAQIHTG